MNFELLTEENFEKLTRKQQREYLSTKVEEFVQLMNTSSKDYKRLHQEKLEEYCLFFIQQTPRMIKLEQACSGDNDSEITSSWDYSALLIQFYGQLYELDVEQIDTMTGKITNSFTQFKIEEETNKAQKLTKSGKGHKETEADVEMEVSMLEVTEQILKKLSNPKCFNKIGQRTLASQALIDMPPEESEVLSHNQKPQELLKLERNINGGGEGSLALDGPRAIENLIMQTSAVGLSAKQKSIMDIPYTELMKEFDHNFKEVCNKKQFKRGISRRLNQVRNLIKKEKNPNVFIKQELVENSDLLESNAHLKQESQLDDDISEIDEPLSGIEMLSESNGIAEGPMRQSSIDSQIFQPPVETVQTEFAQLDLQNFKKFGEGPCTQFYQEIGEKFEENHLASKKRTKSIYYHSISKSKSKAQRLSLSKRKREYSDSSSESEVEGQQMEIDQILPIEQVQQNMQEGDLFEVTSLSGFSFPQSPSMMPCTNQVHYENTEFSSPQYPGRRGTVSQLSNCLTAPGSTPSHQNQWRSNPRKLKGSLADKVYDYEQNRKLRKAPQSPVYSTTATSRMMSPFQNMIRETLDEARHNLFSREPSVVEVCDEAEDQEHCGPIMELAPIHNEMINALQCFDVLPPQVEDEIKTGMQKQQSIRDLKSNLKSQIDQELEDPNNGGILALDDIICDHLTQINPSNSTELISPHMAFVGLLHVIAENSKKNLRVDEFQDKLYVSREIKAECSERDPSSSIHEGGDHSDESSMNYQL